MCSVRAPGQRGTVVEVWSTKRRCAKASCGVFLRIPLYDSHLADHRWALSLYSPCNGDRRPFEPLLEKQHAWFREAPDDPINVRRFNAAARADEIGLAQRGLLGEMDAGVARQPAPAKESRPNLESPSPRLSHDMRRNPVPQTLSDRLADSPS